MFLYAGSSAWGRQVRFVLLSAVWVLPARYHEVAHLSSDMAGAGLAVQEEQAWGG